MRIEILSGSPRSNSVTHRLALHLQRVLEKHTEHEVGLVDVREFPMGPLQRVYATPQDAPENHREVADRMFAAQAFILVTPEYNGSYTPELKNLLDHFPKQTRKPFGLATASPGALGGIRAAMQLQQLVPALFGIASPHLLITPQIEKKLDSAGNLLDETFEKSINHFVAEFLWLAEKLVEEKVTA